MSEKLFIPEMADKENLDLYDGFILSMYGDSYVSPEFDLLKLDTEALTNLYTRLMHYVDSSKDGYSKEYKDLETKMGKHIDTEWFQNKAEKCLALMQKGK